MGEMAEPQLSIRSAHAKKVAHRLAKKERRSISKVVEQALDQYERSTLEQPKESAEEFWARIVRENHSEDDEDFDLDAIIRKDYKPHKPIEL
jgi:hypothetical protein